MTPAVKLDAASVRFHERARLRDRARGRRHRDSHRGASGVFWGPSGCGKSTLLRLVADLVTPHARHGVGAGRARRRRRAFNRELGFVFQDPNAPALALGPLENVRFAPSRSVLRSEKRSSQWTPEGPAAARGPWPVARTPLPHELSGGMRPARGHLAAAALVSEPRILLMDETVSAPLDEITRDTLNEELLRIWKQTGTTILFVTHSIPEAVFLSEARAWCWRPIPGASARWSPAACPTPGRSASARPRKFIQIAAQPARASSRPVDGDDGGPRRVVPRTSAPALSGAGPRRREPGATTLLPFATAAALLVAWAKRWRGGFSLPVYIAPTPAQIARTLVAELPTLLRNFAPTAVESFVGFLLGKHDRDPGGGAVSCIRSGSRRRSTRSPVFITRFRSSPRRPSWS